MPQCVETWLHHAMEHRDNKMRTALGKLLIYLVNQRLLQREQCLIGFSKFLPIAIDLICDIPKIWDYIGEVVGKFSSLSLKNVWEFRTNSLIIRVKYMIFR